MLIIPCYWLNWKQIENRSIWYSRVHSCMIPTGWIHTCRHFNLHPQGLGKPLDSLGWSLALIFQTGRMQWRMLLRDFVCDADTWQLLNSWWHLQQSIKTGLTWNIMEYCFVFMAARRDLLTLGIVEVLTIRCWSHWKGWSKTESLKRQMPWLWTRMVIYSI